MRQHAYGFGEAVRQLSDKLSRPLTLISVLPPFVLPYFPQVFQGDTDMVNFRIVYDKKAVMCLLIGVYIYLRILAIVPG